MVVTCYLALYCGHCFKVFCLETLFGFFVTLLCGRTAKLNHFNKKKLFFCCYSERCNYRQLRERNWADRLKMQRKQKVRQFEQNFVSYLEIMSVFSQKKINSESTSLAQQEQIPSGVACKPPSCPIVHRETLFNLRTGVATVIVVLFCYKLWFFPHVKRCSIQISQQLFVLTEPKS